MKSSSKKSPPSSLGKKFKSIFVGEKKEIKLLGIIIAIGLVAIIGLAFSSSKSSFVKEKITKNPNEEKGECEFRNILNGVCVENAGAQIPALAAIMIENHPDSRPQAGLAEAEVVYEAMVEGNFTRFLALYSYNANVSKIGPVRSARPYYLDWVEEYGNPLYLHVGGSPDALALITSRKIWDANEMRGDNSFWRSTDRPMPHNTYTNNEHWQKKFAEENTNPFIGWDFATSSEPCVSQCVDFIEIPYLRPSFVTGWKYSSSTQNYERWQDGLPHKTETGTIHADTIAIVEAPVKVLDSVGRLEMKTIGTGPSIVIMNGRKIMGTWQKSARDERTNFYDSLGKEINFKSGKIWIQIVPRLSMVTFTEL